MLKEKSSPSSESRSSLRVGKRRGQTVDRPNGSPVPAYSLVSEKLRRSSSGSVQCSLFCGGHGCKYETALHWGPEDKALRGLYSHWVTEDLMAMARPSSFLFKVYDLIGQFKSLDVCSVVNLQCAWEHAKCGPGLETSGFTYQPQHLMKEGLYYYNFGWSDYDVPSLDSLLDAVKVVDFALSLGKVAIHCHAGLGRTGVLVACHVVYSQRCSGSQAIKLVRSKRPGSIQTRSQIEIVQQFSLHLSTLWTFHPYLPQLYSDKSSEVNGIDSNSGIYIGNVNTRDLTDSIERTSEAGKSDPSVASMSSDWIRTGLSYDDLLKNQAQVLHGQVQIDLKYIPKVIHDVCDRLVELSRDGSCEPPYDVILHHTHNDKCQLNPALLNALCYHDNLTDKSTRSSVHTIQVEMNSSLNWTNLKREREIKVLFNLIATFFSSLNVPFLSSLDVSQLKPTSPLKSLPDSRTCVVKQLLNTLHSLVSRHLCCDRQDCLVSILTVLCMRLSALFLQNTCEDHTHQLNMNIVANMLMDYYKSTVWSSLASSQ